MTAYSYCQTWTRQPERLECAPCLPKYTATLGTHVGKYLLTAMKSFMVIWINGVSYLRTPKINSPAQSHLSGVIWELSCTEQKPKSINGLRGNQLLPHCRPFPVAYRMPRVPRAGSASSSSFCLPGTVLRWKIHTTVSSGVTEHH